MSVGDLEQGKNVDEPVKIVDEEGKDEDESRIEPDGQDEIGGDRKPGEVDDADGGAEAEREAEEDERQALMEEEEERQGLTARGDGEGVADKGSVIELDGQGSSGVEDGAVVDDKGGEVESDDGGQVGADKVGGGESYGRGPMREEGADDVDEVGDGSRISGEVSQGSVNESKGDVEEEDRDEESEYERSGDIRASYVAPEARADASSVESTRGGAVGVPASLDEAYDARSLVAIKAQMEEMRRSSAEKNEIVFRSFGNFGSAVEVLGTFSELLKEAVKGGGISGRGEVSGVVTEGAVEPEKKKSKEDEAVVESANKVLTKAVEEAKDAAIGAERAAKSGAEMVEVVRSTVVELGGSIRALQQDAVQGAVKSKPGWVSGWRGVVALLLAFSVFFAGGVLVEQRFMILPLYDETEGWREHVWERYGDLIADCVIEARKRGGEIKCEIMVRPP